MPEPRPPSSGAAPRSPPPDALSGLLKLQALPPVFVLPTHMEADELRAWEDRLTEGGAPLTLDIREAKVVVGKVGTKRRAEMELRCRRLWTEPVSGSERNEPKEETDPPRKKRRPGEDMEKVVVHKATNMVDSSTESEAESSARAASEPVEDARTRTQSLDLAPFAIGDFDGVVRVVSLDWLDGSAKAGRLLPLRSYVVYEGKPIERPEPSSGPQSKKQTPVQAAPAVTPISKTAQAERPPLSQGILERAKLDAASGSPNQRLRSYPPANRGRHRFGRDDRVRKIQFSQASALLQETNSEHEGDECEIPEAPDWVKQNLIYACQRSTPPSPPNEAFINELRKIRLGRTLMNDGIGVRAYSTSIAAIAAYPHLIVSAREIQRLPGCDAKLANLWSEWKTNDGVIKEAEEVESDETMRVLGLFYNIWGVGATTAREFYFDRGWRDLDDVVEFGWDALTRVQQIGVKYHEEFSIPIPRPEAESIASKVREHCVKVRGGGVEVIPVGGYRRGKEELGDVDLIVSHRDAAATANMVTDIVASLEDEGWVTHTLTLSLTGTNRGQATLPFRATGSAGHGFDTLDKALVVWQDPDWPSKDADLVTNPKAKNPNIHRRVDIIISPWRTVGCAVAGWTSGTTFQRDLRRYAKKVKGWKFDSSGIRDRSTGEVVELEDSNGVEGSWEDAERRVFEGMGLAYREPWERCTG